MFVLKSLLFGLALQNAIGSTIPTNLDTSLRRKRNDKYFPTNLQTPLPNLRNKRDDKYHMKCHQSHTGKVSMTV